MTPMNATTNHRPGDTEDQLQRGRLVLESLEFREQAARFHADKLELQAALLDAEAGAPAKLEAWLAAHGDQWSSRTEVSYARTLASPASAPVAPRSSISSESHAAPSMELASGNPSKADKHPSLAVASTALAELPAIASAAAPSELPSHTPAQACETAVPLADEALVSPWQQMAEAIEADRSVSPNPLADNPYQAPAPDKHPPLPTLSVTTAKALQPTPTDEPTERRRAWAVWALSPAVLWSTGLHALGLLGMSAYVIHLATKTETMAIVASPYDTETVAMVTPLEMEPLDEPQLEPNPVSAVAPSLNANLASEVSTQVSIPTAMLESLAGQGPATATSIAEATGAGQAMGNPAMSAQFFGVQATGNTFCYVVDNSASMKRDSAFEAAKSELIRSLSTMKPKQRYYIFFFGEEVQRMVLNGNQPEEFPVYATPENIQKTLSWVSRVKIQGGAPPNDALEAAIEMDPDGIFLLFDGDTSVDVAANLRKTNRTQDIISGETPRVSIHTIGFYTQEFEPLMKRIANENRGTYRFVPKPPTAATTKARK